MISAEHFNLRHLRAFWQVAQSGSISAASERAYLSQPAITQALSKLEGMIGARLFVRSSTGMIRTEAGECLYHRVDRALDMIAAGSMQAARRTGRGRQSGRGFHHLLTTVQLRAFLALAETGTFSQAARQLEIARPSVHRAINDIERIAGFALFENSAHGMIPTPAGDVFRKAVLLAFAELRQAIEEVGLLGGRDRARIVVGSLPLARSEILPTVINEMTIIRPDLHIVVRDGAYGDLLRALRYGEIDLLIGALRSPDPADDVQQEALFVDKLAIIARAGHPLAGQRMVEARLLIDYPWVTPSPNIPTREQFDALFRASGTGTPSRIVETSSLVLIRGLLSASDKLTIISRHQVARELDAGLLTALDFPLPGSDREIGITTRHNWSPTATQVLFVEKLRACCAAVGDKLSGN
ncbi:MAG: LysR family transcriptional regulator [Rhizobiaceae bacterium]|nr:LysR family transcriptional regulator [Rhizobiaceae bacterium]